MSVTLDQWLEWKDICSVAGCGRETQMSLSEYLTGCAVKLARTEALSGYRPDDIPAEHLFDVHVAVGQSKGKPNKDWLLERSRSDNDWGTLTNINKNAKLLLRSAVRDFARKESHDLTIAPSVHIDEWDKPIADDDDTTLGDLWQPIAATPDPVQRRDYAELAEQMAEPCLDDLAVDEIDGQIIVATAYGVPMNDPRFEEATGRKHSVLSNRKRALFDNIRQWVNRKYSEDTEEARFYFTGHLISAVMRCCSRKLASPRGWMEEYGDASETNWMNLED